MNKPIPPPVPPWVAKRAAELRRQKPKTKKLKFPPLVELERRAKVVVPPGANVIVPQRSR